MDILENMRSHIMNFDEDDCTCPGCGREDMHLMCPAFGTPFYMSGIPYLVELAKIYAILDKDDKIVLFEALSKVKIDEQLKLKLSSGDVVEPAVFYGEQIIWNPKPEKG
jgi:hypothetical protein